MAREGPAVWAAGSRARLRWWDSRDGLFTLSVLVGSWGLLGHPACFAAAVLAGLSCCYQDLQLSAFAIVGCARLAVVGLP